MKESAAGKLKVGDRVYHHDHDVTGTVIEVGYRSVKIQWSDGPISLTSHRNMGAISRCAE